MSGTRSVDEREEVDLTGTSTLPDGGHSSTIRLQDPRPGDRQTQESDGRSVLRWHRRLVHAVDLLVIAGVWVMVLMPTAPVIEQVLPLLIMIGVATVRQSTGGRQNVSVGRFRTAEVTEIGTMTLELGVALLIANTFVPVDLRGLAPFVVLLFVALAGARSASAALSARLRKRWNLTQRVLLVGDQAEAARLFRMISEHPELCIELVGWVGHPLDHHSDLGGLRWLGTHQRIGLQVAESAVDSVLLATTSLEEHELEFVLSELQRLPVHVHLSAGLAGMARGHVRLSTLGLGTVAQISPASRPFWQPLIKRLLDLVLGGLILLLASPLLAITALALAVPRQGPVLFKQQRVGQNGKPFTLLKFRTMVFDAEDQLAALLERNEREGPLFKMDHDPRVTRLGRILRATSIDELPQLWNVMRGDMSLVGPRPALPAEAAAFTGRLADRCRTLPGITGLWQVESRDNPSFSSYERMDLHYVDCWTIRLDLAIIVATVPAVLGRGARGIRQALTRRSDRSRGLAPTP